MPLWLDTELREFVTVRIRKAQLNPILIVGKKFAKPKTLVDVETLHVTSLQVLN
jgi:hypothetical protein